MPYFPALDGVRAWCVLLVMFDHLRANGHGPGWIDGHLGVDLFFVISGFLITTLLVREHHFMGRVDRRAFFLRRVFRIVPVYLIVLLIYVAVLQMPSQGGRWVQFRAGLPWFLTFLNEFAREPGRGTVFLQTWSLGVEEKFYLVWPFLFWLRWRVWLSLGLLVGVVAAVGQGHLARAYFGLGMGCGMGFWLAGEAGMQWVRRVPPSVALGMLVTAALAEQVSKGWIVAFSAAAVLFLGSLVGRESWLARWHSAAPMVWLGRRSYSMYLVHVLCLNAIEGRVAIESGVRAAEVLAVAYVLTALVAEVLYRAVEQPARRFGRRWLARRQEVAAAL